jgi:hypothetical protein
MKVLRGIDVEMEKMRTRSKLLGWKGSDQKRIGSNVSFIGMSYARDATLFCRMLKPDTVMLSAP